MEKPYEPIEIYITNIRVESRPTVYEMGSTVEHIPSTTSGAFVAESWGNVNFNKRLYLHSGADMLPIVRYIAENISLSLTHDEPGVRQLAEFLHRWKYSEEK